ncbi:serine hydrolase domain-containing protein [Albibacterium bauzanense]|uniref:CubicO group peptidase (Beta-lactamase class C family) n=1 Tax=Albibacterium bauzanense TaxID=653929 RepID=A0A4R1M2T8_9SPHI|nr:serine hydrolase [Albibacterium bauzanense]TCK85532.1 CubicO group peptidase (beta-lactamase class C family) [Albibacterium bauzanense]
MKNIFLLILINLANFIASAQIPDLYKTDGIVGELHRSNIGRVTFMNENIPLNEYQSSDFLKSFELTHNSDLNIRVFMDNSVANYLHRLAPHLSAEELLKAGNLQFTFYVDNKFIYQENIDQGCNFGSGGSKNTSTIFRVPLTSSKGEDWWAMYMWERFKLNGGEKALTDGNHQLKIEIRPYIKIDETIKVGSLIADGQIKLIIKTPKLTAEDIRIQPIQPNSGWVISNFQFDKKKIEMLNAAIASYSLKDITSVVVIHDGKLMLEEYFNGAKRSTLHDTRSAGKSFTSTLMGIAIKDGYIKNEYQTLNTFYNLKQFANYEAKKDSVRIKDLLSMSSAFNGSDANSDSPGNEENMYPTNNWVKFTLDLPMDKAKTNGGKWDYFTAGVVVLGDLLNKNIPEGLEKYADEKLFKPLNITNYQWQYTPQKVVNTAGSLQMTSLDYAKYAQLYKNNGVWNGKQIIPSEWVQKTLTHQIQIQERDNQFYGYLFWNKSLLFNGVNHEIYYCAGNGGNEFLIFKDLPLVIIITSKAFNKPYGHPQADKIIVDYLLPAILN